MILQPLLRTTVVFFVGTLLGGCGSGEEEQVDISATRSAVAADLACTIQAGGCSEFIGNGSGYIWIDGRNQPADRWVGKTLCIKPGTYTGVGLYQVNGSATQPVVLTNCGGQAILNATNGSPFLVSKSRYLKITGTGSSAHFYGLVAGNSTGGQAHLDLREGTSDVEIDHVEVRGNTTGGVGIAFRTYPLCDGTWSRGTWAQYNTKIHDTYVHDTQYEGMYIGPSHYGWIAANGLTPGFDCGTAGRQFEAEVIGLEVINNRLENIGNDGIQIGAATAGMTVQHNVVKNYGLQGNESHSGGIMVNPGSHGLIDSNWIEAVQPYRTQGIAFQGTGGSVISNNVIVGGRWGAMFLRNSDANMGASLPDFSFYNNTVVGSTYQALYFFCSGLGHLSFANNIVAGTPTVYAANGGTACVDSLSRPNLFNVNLSAAGFVNPSTGDFHLLPTSPAVGVGVNLSGVVPYDYDGVARGSGAYDLGAFARPASPVNHAPTLSAPGAVSLLEGESATVTLAASDVDGNALTWSEVSVPSFVKLTTSSAGARTYSIAPSQNQVSQDTTFVLRVSVSDGSLSTTAEVAITVRNQAVSLFQPVRINLSAAGAPALPTGWNGWTLTGAAGDSLSALKDAAGTVTPYSVRVTQGFGSCSSAGGATTGNNSGVQPDGVLQGYCLVTLGSAKVRVAGLSAGKVYSLSLMASRSAQSGVRLTHFAAQSQQADLEATNNQQTLSVLSGLVPDANGELELSVSNASGSSYGYLNSLVLSESAAPL
ncbi:Ig-like domain-containing protein [Hyalangium versicolor]|uniref:Ig-like domain-containing protein n=1 Tax=Hyalangium versicolor TaxID=2861190 RepID=UPI001CCCD25A|nr:right-handed parallel beta-helix repeat-containing protein [Hyalangium versicolor]